MSNIAYFVACRLAPAYAPAYATAAAGTAGARNWAVPVLNLVQQDQDQRSAISMSRNFLT